MNGYFKDLVERAQYYAQFEYFRNKYGRSSNGIEQGWTSPEGTEKIIKS